MIVEVTMMVAIANKRSLLHGDCSLLLIVASLVAKSCSSYTISPILAEWSTIPDKTCRSGPVHNTMQRSGCVDPSTWLPTLRSA